MPVPSEPFRPPPAFERSRAQRARRPRRERKRHPAARRGARVVGALDAHFGFLVAPVHHPQPAHLVGVPPRVEDDHPVPLRTLRRHVVHAGQEPVAGADVGQHIELQGGAHLEPPVPAARPDAAGEPLARVALLQVRRVEVHRFVRGECQAHRPVHHPRIVYGLDAHLAGLARAVDHPRKALHPLAFPPRGGREVGHLVTAFALRLPRHARQVRQVTRRAREQAQHPQRLRRAHHQAPLAAAPAQRPAQTPGTAALERPRAQRARGARLERQRHRAARRLPRVVDALDAHLRLFLARVDHPQPARLVDVATRVEDDHPVPLRALRRHVVHARQEPVAGADVRQHLQVERGAQRQTPLSRPCSRGAREPLRLVAILQVRGVEVRRLAPTQAKRRRSVHHAGVVVRLDAHLSGLPRAIDHPREALPARRIAGGRKQRYPMRALHRAAGSCLPQRAGRCLLQHHLQRKRVRRQARVRRRCVHRARHPRMRRRALHLVALLRPQPPPPFPRRLRAHLVARTRPAPRRRLRNH